MSNLVVTDQDLVELQSLYPLCRFDQGFTGQEERFLLYILRGLAPKAAASASGYPDARRGLELIADDRIQAAVKLLQERERIEIRVTRDKLNAMLFDAHAKAGTATEEIMAIKELGKMNDLYADAKHKGGTTVQVNVGGTINNVKQIERMNDAQLLEMAGEQGLVLDSADYVVKDVDDDA